MFYDPVSRMYKSVSFNGDTVSVRHVQDVDPSALYARDSKRENDNGFSRTREFRSLGVIPAIYAIKQPELMYDDGAVKKFFIDHPEFRTCRERSF